MLWSHVKWLNSALSSVNAKLSLNSTNPSDLAVKCKNSYIITMGLTVSFLWQAAVGRTVNLIKVQQVISSFLGQIGEIMLPKTLSLNTKKQKSWVRTVKSKCKCSASQPDNRAHPSAVLQIGGSQTWAWIRVTLKGFLNQTPEFLISRSGRGPRMFLSSHHPRGVLATGQGSHSQTHWFSWLWKLRTRAQDSLTGN